MFGYGDLHNKAKALNSEYSLRCIENIQVIKLFLVDVLWQRPYINHKRFLS